MTSTVCAPALKTKPIPTCVGEIIIGTIALLSTNVIVYLTDITTGAISFFQETSGVSGIVSISPEVNQFSDKHNYEIYITAVNTQVKQTITVGSETAEDIALNFMRVVEGEEIHEAVVVTLEVE